MPYLQLLLIALAVLGWLALYWWLLCREKPDPPPRPSEPLPPEFWERWRAANEEGERRSPKSPPPFDKPFQNPYDSDKPGGLP